MPLDVRPSPRGADVAATPRRDRTIDRRLTFGGLATAVGFVALGLASLALPESQRLGTWLPLHLVLAGGAATAISALLPFFSAALAAAPPAPVAVRASGIVLVASGALAAAVGRAGGATAIAANGGFGFLVGLAFVGLAAALPLRRALGVRRRLVELAYGVALLDVAVGVALATGYLAGDAGVADAWVRLKPAHAWLNTFGFVGLVIAATLIHLAPTVSGARIRPRRSGTMALVGLALAAPTVALGYGLEADLVVRLGAVVAVVGALGLAIHGVAVWRGRGAWTSDRSWHRFAELSLLVAPIWLVVAASIAAWRVLADGASPGGWDLTQVIAPLIAGFVLQTLMGASTHLVPAIGRGDPTRHAAQRHLLGLAAPLRVAAWNGGVTGLAVGLVAGGDAAPWTFVVRASAVLLAASLAVTLALLGRAAAPGPPAAAGVR